MPGSPASDSSDYSQSSASTVDYCSQPSSPVPEEPRKSIVLKPALRRHGVARGGPAKCVSWDPNTVFETRPIQRKRSHAAITQAEEPTQADTELCAPIPRKKAKIAELETHAAFSSALHQLPSFSNHPSNCYAEASRAVIPSFNFDAMLVDTTTDNAPTPAAPAPNPTFVPFSLAPKRKSISLSSKLLPLSH